jgi:hypothetical protein
LKNRGSGTNNAYLLTSQETSLKVTLILNTLHVTTCIELPTEAKTED